MKRRLSFLGLVAVCAMAFAAVVASGAGAATALETNNTAFTCVAGSGTLNADCEPGSSGTSGHVGITAGESTELRVVALTEPTLKVKLAGTTTTFTATDGAECLGCTAHNQEPTTGVMDVTGEGGKVKFDGVTINVTNCKVAGGTVTTQALKLTTLSPTKVTLEPKSGTVMAEIVLENNGAPCPLLGVSPVVVEGHVDGTLNGAKATFASVAGMLHVGVQNATLNGVATASAKKSTDGSFTAVSLT